MRGKLYRTFLGACVFLAGTAGIAGTGAAAENVAVTIIPMPGYGAFYIAKEKNLAPDLNIDIKIIDDITGRNAAISTDQVQCMLTTLDSTLVARAVGVPVKHVAVPLMSYGLDQMVVKSGIDSVENFKGKSFAAELGFYNQLWMLLTLKRAGIPFDAVEHRIMTASESAAAFTSGAIDIDVSYLPYSLQSQQAPGAKVFKTTLTDKTWERGLISDSIACNEGWLQANPETAAKLMRAWFAAVDWWEKNPAEGDAIVAKGMGMEIKDVDETMSNILMININQNMGALGLPGGVPLCASIPANAPKPPAEQSGWGKLFGGKDCEAGYLAPTWQIIGQTYVEAKVIDIFPSFDEGVDQSIIKQLMAAGDDKTFATNQYISSGSSN